MSFIDQLQHYWVVILFVGTIIASWVRNESKIEALNSKITEIKDDMKKDSDAVHERLRAAEVKFSSIDSISGDIKGINAKLDIILKKIQL